MATQQATKNSLPGRRHGGKTGREGAVVKYAQAIAERADLSPDEKRVAVIKYAQGMGVDEKVGVQELK